MKVYLEAKPLKLLHVGKLPKEYGEPDFHVRVKGTRDSLGSVSDDAAPGHVPVHNMDHRIHPEYLKHVAKYVHMSKKLHGSARGTTNLQHVTNSDIHREIMNVLLRQKHEAAKGPKSYDWLDKHKRAERMDAYTHLLGSKLKKKHPGLKSIRLVNTGEEKNPKLIHLDDIEVDRAHRKKGVGSAVMKELSKHADRHRLRMTLQVASKNKATGTTSSGRLRKFYRRHGFVRNFGRTKDYSLSWVDMYRNSKRESVSTTIRVYMLVG